MSSRFTLFSLLIALIGGFGVVYLCSGAPGYTDAYYHFNVATRLVEGQGYTDTYLWTYIGAEAFAGQTVYPSHLYWMPLTSTLAALGMTLAGNDLAARILTAKVPFALLLAGTVGWGFWLGWRLGGTRRHALLAGLLTLFSGFFTRFWGQIDTFAPFAFFGAGCLAWMGMGLTSKRRIWLWWGLGGAFAAFAHLTRPDGLLLLLIGVFVIVWRGAQKGEWRRIALSLVMLGGAYALIMLPWFIRNLNELGTPLPLGGTAAIWFTEYDDLFRYPTTITAADFFAQGGLGLLLRTRWQALAGDSGLLGGNLGTFLAVEGMIVLLPLMLVGAWRRRRLPFLLPFLLYAVGLHLAFTLVFPFPGYRGGLFHSAAALVPWWAALGVVGLDDVIAWVARRRRNWQPFLAQWVFGVALVLFALVLSLSLAGGVRLQTAVYTPPFYQSVLQATGGEGRILINDPAALYYYTRMGGAVLPNAEPERIQEVARQYAIDHVLLEVGGIPSRLSSVLDSPPNFLTPLQSLPNFYQINREPPTPAP